jgi:predicted ATPase
MRIAISGCAASGKTTTIQHFLQRWPSYSLINSEYRTLIKDKKHSKETTPKLQSEILDILSKECEPYTLHQNVIFDRCPIDNLVYSMWCYGNNVKGFTDKFIEESILKTRKAMQYFDVIFICTRDLMPPIEDNGVREIDPKYVEETDNLFKAIINKYKKGAEELPFFEKNNAPAIIDIHGQPHERLAQIAMYVTEDGNMYGEDQSLINLDELGEMTKLVREQQDALKNEKTPIFGIK